MIRFTYVWELAFDERWLYFAYLIFLRNDFMLDIINSSMRIGEFELALTSTPVLLTQRPNER